MTAAITPQTSLAIRRSFRPVSPPPLDQHAPSVYLASLNSAEGRRSMASGLRALARVLTGGKCDIWTLPWHRLRFQHTAALRAVMVELWGIRTVNQRLSALRGVLKTCWRLGQMSTDDYMRAVDIKSLKGRPLPSGRSISVGELITLFQQCAADGGAPGARDACILGILYQSGLRRFELSDLNFQDFDESTGELRIERGKGAAGRMVYLFEGAMDAMKAWLSVRGRAPGPLFYAVTKGGRLTKRRLHDQSIYDMLKRRGRRAGLKHFSTHDFRRTLISHLLERGADLKIVSLIVGHMNVNTTGDYDRRGEDEKKKAQRLIHVPYVPMTLQLMQAA